MGLIIEPLTPCKRPLPPQDAGWLGPGRVTLTAMPDGPRHRVQGSSARHEDHPHGPLHLQRRHGQGDGCRPERERPGGQSELAVPYQGAYARHGVSGMLLVGARRGGKTHAPEAQIVPQSPRAVRGRLRGMQLGHPSVATGGGQVRGHALLAPSWGRIRPSVEAAVATYLARYRRHRGAELALQGGRLGFSQAYLAFQAHPARLV